MTVQIIGLGNSQQQQQKQQKQQKPVLRLGPPPPPTKAQLNVIRDSWERVLRVRRTEDVVTSASAAFTQTFYDGLFSLNKDVAKPFSNIQRQASCLTGIVSYIARAPAIMPARYKNLKLREMERGENAELDQDEERWMEGQLQALGARHALAVDPLMLSWFDHVGPALVMALQRRLDREFGSDVGDAWLQAHQYVAYHIKLGFKHQLEKDDGQTRGTCAVQ